MNLINEIFFVRKYHFPEIYNEMILLWYVLAKILIGPSNAYPMDFPRGIFLLINNETFDESAAADTNSLQGNLYINSFIFFKIPQLIFRLVTYFKQTFAYFTIGVHLLLIRGLPV